jgi:hypothetical protein
VQFAECRVNCGFSFIIHHSRTLPLGRQDETHRSGLVGGVEILKVKERVPLASLKEMKFEVA